MTEIPDSILEQFMICAFRYALERSPGVLTQTLGYIDLYWDVLNPEFKRQIREDIMQKIQANSIHRDDLTACKRILDK